MKGQTFLKVTSILMIIGGAFGIIGGILAAIAAAALGAGAAIIGAGTEAGGAVGLLVFAAILLIVSGVFQLIAGIKGLGACKAPEKAGGCIVIGIIIAGLSVLSQVLTVVGGGSFNAVNLATSLILPVLYIVAANQVKSNTAA